MEAYHYMNTTTANNSGASDLPTTEPSAGRDKLNKKTKAKGILRHWSDHEKDIFIDILFELVA